MKPLLAIDVCAGAGGWACAAKGLPVEIVLAVDMWEDACMTYELNFPGTRVMRADIRGECARAEIVREYHGRVDLVLGAIPCAWISVMRHIWQPTLDELERERATLKAALRMTEQLGPRFWCFEDVVQIRKELPEGTPNVVIDAADYSAQRRRRCFFGRFPEPALGACTETTARHLRPGPYRLGTQTLHRGINNRGYSRDSSHGIYADQKCVTIVEQSSRHDPDRVVVDSAIPTGKRQMEWQEAARLQGFPEDFVFYGSPTSVGKMVGQAIQIDTGRAILEAIVEEANA